MKSNVFILSAIAAFAGLPPLANAQTTITLGSAENFGLLAGTTITGTGINTVYGNVGTSPGATITGFPPGVVVGGTIYAGGAIPAQAQADVTTAYNVLTGESATQDLTGQNLGGLVLSPGVYSFSTAAQLTGTLTLDGGGNPNARFDFQIGSTLTTDIGSHIILINGAQLNDIFWQVGSSATLGANSTFDGNILALTSITENGGVEVDGRLLARTGAITLAGGTTTIPEPGTTALCMAGFASLVIAAQEIRRRMGQR